MSLDCRKCGAVLDDPFQTGRCRFCNTPYRVDPMPNPSAVAAAPGKAVIEVVTIGENKIAVVKVIHETFKCGLKAAKDMTEQRAPFHITVDRAMSEAMCTRLVEAGAQARIVV